MQETMTPKEFKAQSPQLVCMKRTRSRKKWIRKNFSTDNVIKKLIWIILLLTAVSTFFSMFYPLLPNADEYVGSFPEAFWQNFDTWIFELLPRRLVLFHEYYNFPTLLLILGNLFLLVLVRNIRNVLAKPLKSEALVGKYLVWAVSGILITIVFMSKWISAQNIVQLGLGLLALAVSIFVLLYLFSYQFYESQPTTTEV